MTSTSTTSAGPRPAARDERLLRPALQVDAAVTGLNGAVYLAAAPVLDDLLGLPAGTLRGLGGFLLVFAVAVGLIGTRTTIRTGPVAGIITTNLLWVAASIAVAVNGWHDPTTAGTVWIVLQAAVVTAFAALQLRGLRARPAT